jgi:aminoglycoside 2'-N-acetyltransferase I
MSQLRTAHTADVDHTTLAAARALLEDVFAGEMTAHDWEHSLGSCSGFCLARGRVGEAEGRPVRTERCS